MKASLIFSSTSHSINVQKVRSSPSSFFCILMQPQSSKCLTCLLPMSYLQIFKIVLSKAFDIRCTIPEIEHTGEPLLLYQSIG